MSPFVLAILVKLKSAAISAAIGYIMKFVVDEVKTGTPWLWAKVPEAAKPFVSAALGTAVAVLNDPTQIVVSAASGAAGGAMARVTHEEQKKTVPPVIPGTDQVTTPGEG